MARVSVKIAVYLLMFLSFPSFAHGQTAPTYVPGEVIVKLRSESQSSNGRMKVSSNSFLSKASTQRGLTLKTAMANMGVFHFSLKAGQKVEDAIRDLKSDPEVEYAEPNYYLHKADVQGEAVQSYSASEVASMATTSSYLATGAPIHVTDAWGTVTPNSVPVVAIIDTGLDITHPVFADSNAVWTNVNEIPNNGIDDDHNGYVDDVHGWNFVSHSGYMHDDDRHGTHVAGIILSVGQNIYSPPYAQSLIKLMPLKFLDSTGQGTTSDAISAIYYAVNNGATVLNNSWGGPSYSASLHEAIAYSYNRGVVFVAAAGNYSENNDVKPMYPAGYNVPNVIAVAATLDNDTMAYFSNYGKGTVPLAAPGSVILSTAPGGGYITMSGTSMAAPFVSGVAGLMQVEKPGLLGYQTKQLIMADVDVPTDSYGQKTLQNKVETDGRLNVFNTLHATKLAAVDTTQPNYSFSSEDRELASAIAAGGCGLVRTMMDEPRDRNGGGGPGAPESWSVLILIGLMALPYVMYNMLRRRDARNRRQFDRYKIDSEVKISVGGRELVGSVSTISLGGAGLTLDTDALIEKGGIVAMTIRSPDGKEQIEVQGRVVWNEANKAYGVQFANTTQTLRERITLWTRSLVKT